MNLLILLYMIFFLLFGNRVNCNNNELNNVGFIRIYLDIIRKIGIKMLKLILM